MSTRVVRGPAVRGYHRRKSTRNLDLNSEPPDENSVQREPSSQMEPQVPLTRLQRTSLPPTTIDVEAIEDDLVESSARAFAEAKNKSRRHAERTVVDVDSEEQTRIHNKRRRAPQNQLSRNTELFINLEGNSNSTREKSVRSPPPNKEPVFSCPICMGSIVEETSTKCGHIFCKACIKTAVSVQAKCPTCRKKISMKELIRVYLPAKE